MTPFIRICAPDDTVDKFVLEQCGLKSVQEFREASSAHVELVDVRKVEFENFDLAAEMRKLFPVRQGHVIDVRHRPVLLHPHRAGRTGRADRLHGGAEDLG